MDTITHTLFGLAIYGAFKKDPEAKKYNRALLVTAIGASQIPDIDVISKWWDTQGLYQMWHRGITHSVFLTPLWALLFFLLAWSFFRIKDKRLFFISWLAVFIHITSDLFNAWGTGFFEPFSQVRITFGTIPIINLVFWVVILVAFMIARKKNSSSYKVYRIAWLVMAIHVVAQSLYGYFIYQQYENKYEQIALSADFVPFNFSVIGKKEGKVDIIDTSFFKEDQIRITLQSNEKADLDLLFKKRPEAKTLYQWAPFVVIVDDEKYLGLYDPRFYRDGQSFLFEKIEKAQLKSSAIN
jgi:inner membrane protein